MNFSPGKQFIMDKRLQQLNRALAGQRLGQPLLWFDTVPSTNDALKQQAEAGAPEGCTIMADEQTRGRGRRGKIWLSTKGKGVYMSLLLRPRWPAAEAGLIGMLAVIGVARALEAIGVGRIGVKWPNDVLADGKKIAGILVEPRLSRRLIDFVVVGIGINVRHGRGELDIPGGAAATSCRLEGVRTDCDRVAVQTLKALEYFYAPGQGDLQGRILEEWTRRQAGPLPRG